MAKANQGKTGEYSRHKKARPKRGTDEFRDIMIVRPQTQNFGERMRDYWTGRKQTPEHIRKRTVKKGSDPF